MLRVSVHADPGGRAAEPVESGDSIVVYGAGRNQIPVIEACRRRGWRVIAIDRDPNAPGSPLADRFICVSLRDHAAIHEQLEGETFGGVVARVTDREALESSYRLAEERGLVGPCSDLLAASTSKRALGEICMKAGLPTPRRLTAGDTIQSASGYVILRPDVTIRGKVGIYRASSASRLEALAAQSATGSANGEIDVCEWIEGADVSVLAQLDRGRGRRLALWDEWVAVESSGVIRGLGCGMPSRCRSSLPAIDTLLDAVASRFSRSRCLIALSVRVDPSGQPFIIEIHLGIGGDSIADVLIPAALPGVDVFDSAHRS